MPPPPATAGIARPKGNIAATHDASLSIRARAQAKTQKDKGAAPAIADSAGMNKDVVKAVLASPLTVEWPNIPRHLQTTVMHAVRELVPNQISDYHVSRARCHTKEKRSARREARRTVSSTAEYDAQVQVQADESALEGSGSDADHAGVKRKAQKSNGGPPTKKARSDATASAGAQQTSSTSTVVARPDRPEVLSHLVLGINEVVKSLERQIDELKLRLQIMADALNGRSSLPTSTNMVAQSANHLLPTAPRSPSSSPEPEAVSPTTKDPSAHSPITFIVVPLLSVNPQSLVSPIPPYCATYNSLVYQYTQLAKTVRTRVAVSDLPDVLGEEREEVRVVPLGNVEKEMAQLVGLKRLACLGVRSSHPQIKTLQRLLPKSVLHPPRHRITLPYPTSSLKVHTNSKSQHKLSSKPNGSSENVDLSSAKANNALPIAHVHYAPLHVKGIQTTVPVDNAAKKAQRLEEVRRKRIEAKERRRVVREGMKKVVGSRRGQGKAKSAVKNTGTT